MPRRLYKYIPSEYVDSLVRRGRVLLRNLTFYRGLEDKGRGDLFEGRHVDRPGDGVELTVMRTGEKIVGDFASVNAVDAQRVFVFCMSTCLEASLYDEFNCDACVEVTSPALFFRHCRQALKKRADLAAWTSKHQAVEYYAPDKAAERDVKDPNELAFFKPEEFRQQCEYRLAMWSPPALTCETRIIVGDALERVELEKAERSRKLELRLPGNSRSRQYMRVHFKDW